VLPVIAGSYSLVVAASLRWPVGHSGGGRWVPQSCRQRVCRQRPMGQCSTVMSSMGKSVGLPVAKRASMPVAAAAIRQSAG